MPDVTVAVRYPLCEEPTVGDGSAVEVSPGVLWLRMPLAGSLRWINLWALADGDGWTIVDTGVLTPDSIESWLNALAGVLQNKPVVRVIVTHMALAPGWRRPYAATGW